MKITSLKPRGQRIYKSSIKSTRNRPLWIEPIGRDWWFNLTTGEWQEGNEDGQPCTTSFYAMKHYGFKDVWSIKAAKRAIAKWNVPKGTWFKVSMPWVGHEFNIKKP